MDHTRTPFHLITQRIFSNWTALRLAVEHDMGPVEQARQFCFDVTEMFYTMENICLEEVTEYLEDFMCEVFTTELQDDSAIEVASLLCTFFQYYKNGNLYKAEEETDKLPALQSWICSVQQPSRLRKYESSSDDDMDISENKNKTDDDGWTVVTNKRNK